MDKRHPMQPIVLDRSGVARFKMNALVRFLLDWATERGLGLNELALLPNIPQEDHEQLAQLIGYSVSGAGDLPYFNRRRLAQADAVVEKMLKARKDARTPRH